jgi:hypothetical protein
MASTDARPVPQKNVAYRVTFPILDADGDLVTGAAGLDSEISKDGGTFADCTNEATEIATNSGMYYLDLTSTEMNADCVAIIVKTSTSGAKTVPIVLYPEEAGDIRVNATQWNSGTIPAVNVTGVPLVDAKYLLGTVFATPATAGIPDINVKNIANAVVDTTAAQIGVNVVNWKGSAAAAMTGDAFARLGASAGASHAADVAAVKTDTAGIKLKTDNLPSDPADASDVAAAFSTVNATLATVASYIDTEVAAIKAKTDNLPASPAAVGSAMTLTSAYDFAKGTAAMAEAYAANGVAPTPVQALFAIHQMLMAFGIVGTALTVKKLDGSTTAFVGTLNDATTPSALARS